MNFKTLIILFVAIGSLKIVQAQTTLSPFYGKTFDKKNGVIAVRAGIGLNNFYKNRIGFYYLYEFQGAVMPFVNTTVTGNYRRDILGITCKLHNHFTVLGGIGVFTHGIFSNTNNENGQNNRLKGLRKEIQLRYNHPENGFFFGAGYSFSIGPTANIGFNINLTSDHKTVHQSLTED